jgi:photosystem II stability/assembly factor-like uncharacterized protein
MKSMIKIPTIAALFFFAIFLSNTYAQQGWFWQNPLPQGNTLYDVFFLNSSEGWAVGENGTIIHTSDGGMNWTLQKSGGTSRLTAIHFTDSNNGCAIGYYGTLLHTVDGGNSWNSINSGTTHNLTGIHFINANEGWVSAHDYTILQTTDGGSSWSVQQSTPGTTHFTSICFTDGNPGPDNQPTIFLICIPSSFWMSTRVGQQEQTVP